MFYYVILCYVILLSSSVLRGILLYCVPSYVTWFYHIICYRLRVWITLALVAPRQPWFCCLRRWSPYCALSQRRREAKNCKHLMTGRTCVVHETWLMMIDVHNIVTYSALLLSGNRLLWTEMKARKKARLQIRLSKDLRQWTDLKTNCRKVSQNEEWQCAKVQQRFVCRHNHSLRMLCSHQFSELEPSAPTRRVQQFQAQPGGFTHPMGPQDQQI